MKCPKCEVELAESYLGDHKSVVSDICPKCQGVWLDKGELDSLSSGGEGLLFEVVSSAPKNLKCPRCQKELESVSPEGAKEIIIDRCSSCNRFWLDKGELDQVRDFSVELDEKFTRGLNTTLAIIAFVYGMVLILSFFFISKLSVDAKTVSLLLGIVLLVHSLLRYKGVYKRGPLNRAPKYFLGITVIPMLIISFFWAMYFVEQLIPGFAESITDHMESSTRGGRKFGSVLIILLYIGIPALVFDIYYCFVASLQKKKK